jgi:hypothetical protein
MGAGDAGLAASEEAVAAVDAFSERPGVCAERLITKITEEMSRAGVPQRIQRGYFDDKDFLAVADFMAALPPICLVSRAQAIYPTGGAL